MTEVEHHKEPYQISNVQVIRLLLLGAVIISSWLGAWRAFLPYDIPTAVAALISGLPIFKETIESLRNRTINMEASMTIGAIASVIVGEFLPAAVIIFFALLAEELEELTMDRGRHAIEILFASAPTMARVKRNGGEVSVPAEHVMLGEAVLVRAGEKVPVDGLVRKGTGFVNEAPITGESMPVEKLQGDKMFAGSINDSGFLEVEATRVGKDTTFARIINLVEEAERSKAPIARLGDRLAAGLVYLALILAALTYIVTRNAVSAISVIVVAGACGIAAGTPLALLASVTRAAKRGIIVKGGAHIEQLSSIDTVVIDKTGTLTLGEPKVVSLRTLDDHNEQQLIQLAATAEVHTGHPVARAILRKAEELQSQVPEHTSCEYFPGKGVVCNHDGDQILVGNRALLAKYSVKEPSNIERLMTDESYSGRTAVLVAHNRQTCGVLSVSDVVRQEAKQAILRLKAMGLEVIMLTGDNQAIAKNVAKELGIDVVYADLLPDQKLNKIRELIAAGKKVMMIGDGINDAPALAEATIGVAMGSGTDVALETSNIALMTSELDRVPQLISLGKENRNVIMQNFTGTIVVDAFGVVLAIVGIINPLIAAFIHTVSELAFMLNSARLLRS